MNIEIDNDIAQKLQSIAAIKNVTVSDLLRGYVSEQELFAHEKLADQRSWDAAEQGNFVDNETVMQWLECWGTDNETPCPIIK